MQKLVVMEGADRVGKTNIGQGISKKYGIPYFRMATQHENWRKGQFKTALQFDQTYITQFLLQTGHSAVCDRMYPSEWVYSRVFGRDTDSDLLEHLDNIWSRMGAWIIIPQRKSFEGIRSDEVVPYEKLAEIQHWYNEFFEWTKCNVITFYVDDPQIGCDLNRELELIGYDLDHYFAREDSFCSGMKVRYNLL